uniref:Tyrosine-protein kinase n=1 Tax=Trichuris muris TaxID=70415 RepID=A0A5S6QA73_TRIMR
MAHVQDLDCATWALGNPFPVSSVNPFRGDDAVTVSDNFGAKQLVYFLSNGSVHERNGGGSSSSQATTLMNRIKVVGPDPAGFGFTWFHGSISRDETNRRLTDQPDGTFLIRESTNYPGDYTLCIAFRGNVEHYRIFNENLMLTCDHEGFFQSLQLLVAHYVKDADGLCHKLVRPLPLSDFQKYHSTGHLDESVHSGIGDSPWVIDKDDLQLNEVIGHGEFGDVVAGVYRGQKVAIKVMKRGNHVIESLLQEASMMMSLQHHNLVRLLGVVFNEITDIYLVTEFMANGSLLDYLRSRGRQMVTQSQQLGFARDVCSGMVYLEMKNLVHRDLAARNILLSEEMTAKVADFGLARSADLIDAEDVNSKFPIKWTAPEALRYNKFTCKSDVWSFGILLWEVYSFGRVPYPRIPVQDVVRHIEKGYRMEPPEGCPSDVADLMMQTFKSPLLLLTELLSNGGEMADSSRKLTESFRSYIEDVVDDSKSSAPQLIQCEQHVVSPCEQVILYSPFSDSRQGLVGTLYCTIFRLLFRPATDAACRPPTFASSRFIGDPKFETPLLNIHHLEYSTKTDSRKFKPLNSFLSFTDEIYSLKILCKDFRVFTFDLHLSSECKTLVNCLLQYSFPSSSENLPCFILQPSSPDNARHSRCTCYGLKKAAFDRHDDWRCELLRTGSNQHHWRITACSRENQQVNKYPSFFVVPLSWPDGIFGTAAANWSCQRGPFWCWSHPNGCALLRAAPFDVDSEVTRKQWHIFEISVAEFHPSGRKPAIVEMPVKVKEVAMAFEALRRLCSVETPNAFWMLDAKWNTEVDSTGWLVLVQRCLQACLACVDHFESSKTSVVIRGAKPGWVDASCVISSLSQLCMDPFSRTIDGFDMLIRKDWFAFGHPFALTLHCLAQGSRREDEMAPFFLLFLDCVYQLLCQFPGEFEFTEYYLIALWDLALSGLTVAFSVNCLQERSKCHPQSTVGDHDDDDYDWSRWFTDQFVDTFQDPLFLFTKGLLPLASAHCAVASPAKTVSVPSSLRPSSSPPALRFWTTAYLRWAAPAQISGGGSVQKLFALNSIGADISNMLSALAEITTDEPNNGANKQIPGQSDHHRHRHQNHHYYHQHDQQQRVMQRFRINEWRLPVGDMPVTSAFPFSNETLPTPDYIYILPIRPNEQRWPDNVASQTRYTF